MNSDKKYIVYKHTNKINNKSYIGITCQQPQKRWKNGFGYTKHQKFYSAILKYGWDNFQHEILYNNLSQKEAEEKEKQLIIIFDTINNGYNITAGGIGSLGYHHTNQNKQQISNSMKKFLEQHPQEIQRRKNMLLNPENRKKAINKRNEYFKAGSENAKKRVQKNNKKIICLNTKQVFNSVNEAAQWCKIDCSGISKCLKKIQKTSGKHPQTNQPLKWQYYYDDQ